MSNKFHGMASDDHTTQRQTKIRQSKVMLAVAYEAYKDEGMVILAINEEESVETVRPFIQANNFTFPVLLDLQGQVAQQYSTRSYPTTFIIDRDGVIQHIQTGQISERELEMIVLPLLQ